VSVDTPQEGQIRTELLDKIGELWGLGDNLTEADVLNYITENGGFKVMLEERDMPLDGSLSDLVRYDLEQRKFGDSLGKRGFELGE